MITTTIIIAAFTATAQAERPDRDPAPPATIARTQVATWTCQTQLREPRTPVSRSPWTLGGSWHYRQWVLALWTQRRVACLGRLHEQARQWNWQAFLPDKWRRIAVCETGMNWRHANNRFQGAFGFAVASWDGFKLPGYPDEAYQASPWQQYQVALAIYARYGLSGWGCRNA